MIRCPKNNAGRGGAQPDPGSMVDDSMPELRREAEALGADAVALAEAYSLASQQRDGAVGLSAGVAMDLRFGMGTGASSRPGQSREDVERRETHLLIVSPMCLSLSLLQALNTKPDELAEFRDVIWSLHAV